MSLEVCIHYLPCLLLQTIRSLHLIKEAFSLFSPKCQCPLMIRYNADGYVLVFLPPQPASAHLGASEISHRKKKPTHNTFEGWLWSQLIMFPWRSNAMGLTMNSLVEPFLPGGKKPQRTILLNDYTLQYSCVIDLQKTHLYPTLFS